MKRIAVVGNDLAAMKAISLIAARCRGTQAPACSLAGVLVDASSDPDPLLNHCQRLDLPAKKSSNFNGGKALKYLRDLAPDLIFSLGNLQILRTEFLSLAPEGVVNFHNALLPRHAGGNACTWALVQGDEMHGVTCHYVDEGVDTGDIIAQVGFTIKENDTAFDLLVRCIEKSLNLLQRVLPLLLEGNIAPVRQDLSRRTHHLFKEVPHGGVLEFNWPAKRLHDFVRGLNLGPILDTLPRAKTFHKATPFFVDNARILRAGVEAEPGTVLRVAGKGITVQAGDALVELTELRNRNNELVPVTGLVEACGIKPGSILG